MRTVLTSLPSDCHTWNLSYLQLLLEDQGMEVINLGACVSTETVIQACRTNASDLLVVSSVNGHALVEGRELIHRLSSDEVARYIPVVIGGKLTTSRSTEQAAARELLEIGFARVFTGDQAIMEFVELLQLLGNERPRKDRAGEAPWRRIIGIVGGLGPFAHIELESRLLEAARRKLGHCPHDQEFPPWIVASLPQTPDRTTALLGRGPCPLPSLVKGLRLLHEADFALIPCNTAHAFVPRLRREVSLPILDMVAETLSFVHESFGAGARVGLLASSGTLASGIYHQAARLAGRIRILSPFDLGDGNVSGKEIQERFVMGAIFGRPEGEDDLCGGIKSGAHRDGKVLARIRSELSEVIRRLRDHGADAIILGCTELPLALGREPIHGLPSIDPLEVAASAAIDIAAGDRPLPA